MLVMKGVEESLILYQRTYMTKAKLGFMYQTFPSTRQPVANNCGEDIVMI